MARDLRLLKRIKNVDQKTENTVNGFIHENEKEYLFNIPIIIIKLILCYYYSLLKDQWNKKYHGNKMILKSDFLKIKKQIIEGYYGNAYLTNIINAGVYSWKFKIHKIDTKWSLLDIGI